MVKIVSMGDNVVDCYPARSEMYPGGNCLNVAIQARRFGAQTSYVGAIGRDRAGELIAAALEQERVDVSRLRRLDGPTAYCLIGHRNADRIFIDFDLGVSMFTPSEDDIAFVARHDAVHIGQSSGLDAWIDAAASKTLLSYDFSTRRDAGHRKEIGRHCFLASLSGESLAAADVESTASELLDAGSRWVLVTRGRSGAVLFDRSGSTSAPAQVIDPVDTLGAGDAFIARTLVGLIEDEAPDAILRHAASAAAAACGYFGAVGHPGRIDLGPGTDAILRDITAHNRGDRPADSGAIDDLTQ